MSRLLVACAVLAGVGALGIAHRAQRAAPAAARATSQVRAPAPPQPKRDSAPAAPLPAPASPITRYVIIGGGPLPESTEVSLEQNAELALERMPGASLYFAGGAGTQSVRVEAREDELKQRGSHAALAVRLGELFSPRKGRTSRYRATDLPGAQRADRAALLAGLQAALAQATDEPLVVYVAAHGDQGEMPADNAFATWGNDSITPRDLAELHDPRKRPLRLVIASCFSGGFGELAFAGADAAQGVTRAPRCGLFAGTWDRETAGCDPDPDRSVQEAYSLHLLHALALRDRDGKPLTLGMLDLDHDGRVSLLEAHTRARIASRSIDVPTTTSERFLRYAVKHASERATVKPGASPEEDAVIDQLGGALQLASEAATKAKLTALQEARRENAERVADAEQLLDDAYWALATRLLERFPMLDDAYHPALARTLADNAEEIEALLERSQEALDHRAATAALDRLDAEALDLELDETLVLRLSRAYETRRLQAALRAKGGTAWSQYAALLACERGGIGGW